MGKTEISWTKLPGTIGRTWNPVQGCRRRSPGCVHCYAEVMARRFAKDGWSKGLIDLDTGRWNGVGRLALHKLPEPLTWRAPSTVFVNSMSDLFFDPFLYQMIAAIYGVMAATPQHTYIILTKREDRLVGFYEWMEHEHRHRGDFHTDHWAIVEDEAREALAGLDLQTGSDWSKRFPATATGRDWPLSNVWIGVSCENQEYADLRIPALFQIPAAVRMLSLEPLLGPINLRALAAAAPREHHGCQRKLGWIVAGAESGHGRRDAQDDWFRSLRDQARELDVPFWLKQAEASDNVTPGLHRIGIGPGSYAKAGVVELPYLDGVQHTAYPRSIRVERADRESAVP